MADLIFKMLNYYTNHKKNLKYYACIVCEINNQNADLMKL